MSLTNSNENLNLLEKRIKFLRSKMHMLIETKGDINAPEIIEISQMLDEVLVQYLREKSI